MKKVYFAAPLFCKSERDFNCALTEILEEHGYKVFLPQRDGYEAIELMGMSESEKVKLIFDKDTSEILNSDVFFMVLDGRVPDDGACVGLGIAYANGKKCYGVKTDARSLEYYMDLNPLIAGCFSKIFYGRGESSLYTELKLFLEKQSL